MSKIMRLALGKDSQAILNIYRRYIRETAITFEIEVPTTYDFGCRIAGIAKKYPFIVYQINDEIVGYAYASEHMERAAYRFDVDVSIYVSPQYHASGIAYKLYNALFSILKDLGYVNAYAGITIPNEKSFKFHDKYGFKLIGTYPKTGYKFNSWHDVSWLGKTINKHVEISSPLMLISELPDARLMEIFTDV